MNIVVLAAFAVLVATPVIAQPRITNGEVRQVTIAPTLTRAALDAFASKAGTAWLAYAVPIVAGDHSVCDSMWRGGQPPQSHANPVMMLEGPRRLWVLFRFAEGRVDRIRVASEDCTLDAAGLTVQWAPGVSPADSVAVLSTFAAAGASTRLADGALTALALHGDPAALQRLLVVAREGATTHLRGQALFWLAQRAGEKAIGAISDAIANDPETDVKKRAVFALSQLPNGDGVPRLIEVARTNPNPAVRKQAMFWLGQSKDARAVNFFAEILFK
jgi:hypothetical protein